MGGATTRASVKLLYSSPNPQERKRLEELDSMRQAAEQAMREAQDKLTNAENAAKKAAEAAKERARELKTSVGLAQPIGPHNPSIVSHRGKGAFCDSDFGPEKRNGEEKVVGEIVRASTPTKKGLEEIDAQLDAILKRFKDRAEGTQTATEEKCASEDEPSENALQKTELVEEHGDGEATADDDGKAEQDSNNGEAVKNGGIQDEAEADEAEGSGYVSQETSGNNELSETVNGGNVDEPIASKDQSGTDVEKEETPEELEKDTDTAR